MARPVLYQETMKTTDGADITTRDTAGRFTAHPVCEACRKPIKGEYLSDEDTANRGIGLLLCERARCTAKREAMTVDQRIAHYTRPAA